MFYPQQFHTYDKTLDLLGDSHDKKNIYMFSGYTSWIEKAYDNEMNFLQTSNLGRMFCEIYLM